MEKKLFMGWSNIKKFILELVLTLTAKESRLSQKKILIYLIELSMLSATLSYLYIHRLTMTSGDLTLIVGLWLGKGVTSAIMVQSDKKVKDNNEVPTTTDTN